MSDSGSNWQSRPLGVLATTTSGGTPSRKRKDYYGGSIPWVKSGELNDDFIFDTEEHITEAGLKNSSAKLFPSGTVLGVRASMRKMSCGSSWKPRLSSTHGCIIVGI